MPAASSIPSRPCSAGAPILHPDFNTYFGFKHKQETPSNIHLQTATRARRRRTGLCRGRLVVENTYMTQRQSQGYLEPQRCSCNIDRRTTRSRLALQQGARTTRASALAVAVGIAGRADHLPPDLHRRRLRRQGQSRQDADRLLPGEGDRPAGAHGLRLLEEFLAGNPRHHVDHPAQDGRQARRHDDGAPRSTTSSTPAPTRPSSRAARIGGANQAPAPTAFPTAASNPVRLHQQRPRRLHARARRAPGRLGDRVAHGRDRARDRHGPGGVPAART